MPDIWLTDDKTGRRVKVHYEGGALSDAEIAKISEQEFGPSQPQRPATSGRFNARPALPDTSLDLSHLTGVPATSGSLLSPSSDMVIGDAGPSMLQDIRTPGPAPAAIPKGSIGAKPKRFKSGSSGLPSSAASDAAMAQLGQGAQGTLLAGITNPGALEPDFIDPSSYERVPGYKPDLLDKAMTAARNTMALPSAIVWDRLQGAPERAVQDMVTADRSRAAIGGRAYGPSVIPGMGGFGAGVGAAEVTFGLTGNPWAAALAGLIGGFGGGGLVNKAQENILDAVLSPQVNAARKNLMAQDKEQDPLAVLGGEILGSSVLMRPGSPGEIMEGAGLLRSMLRPGGVKATRAAMGAERFSSATANLAANAVGAATPAGVEAYNEVQSGEGLDPARLALAGAGGLLFSHPNEAGEAVAGAAGRVATAGGRIGSVEMPAPVDSAGDSTVDSIGVGTVRYTKDGNRAEVIGIQPDGRLRVRVEGLSSPALATREKFLSDSNPDARPVSERPIHTLEDLRTAFREEFGLPEAEAAQVSREWERAFAEEARRTGRPVEDVLKERIASVRYGGEILARELMKSQGYKPDEVEAAAQAGKLPHGAVTLRGSDARMVVSALANPNAEAGVHELGHVVRRMLDPAENDIVGEWSGAERDANGQWRYDRDAEEKFADAVTIVRQAERGRDAAYDRVPAPFKKVAGILRGIVDRVQDALPRLRRLPGVDGQVINRDVLRVIDARFGGRSNAGHAGPGERDNVAGIRAGAEAAQAGSGAESAVSSEAEVRPGQPDAGTGSGAAANAAAVAAGHGADRGRGGESVSGSAEAQRDDAGPIEFVDPSTIDVLPGMQFKREIADAKNNVTDQLKNQRDYDVSEGGVLTVWEDKSGRRFAVDGHHRRELAQRADRFVRPLPDGSVTEAPKQIGVQVLKEADGWTPEAAKAWGVRRNLREGKARAIDAADALVTLSGLEGARQELARLPKSALVRDTAGLAELDASGRERVLNRKVSESVAAGIGYALPGDAARQKIALDQATGRKDISTYEDGVSLGREVQSEDVVTPDSKQLGFEGLDVPQARSTAAERTLIKKAVVNTATSQQTNANKGLGLELLPGETINAEQRKAIAAQIGETKGGVTEKIGAAFEYDPAVRETLRQAAVDLAEGKATKAETTQRVWDVVLPSARRPLAEIVSGKASESLGAVSPAPTAGETADSATRALQTDSTNSAYAMEGDDAVDTETASLFHGAPKKRRQEVIAELDKTPFVPVGRIAEALGDRPEYLGGIMRFMAEQRQKVVEGRATARDVAKAYVTTVASQGAGAMRYETLQGKLAAEGIHFDIPEQFRGKSSNGVEIVRPEDAAAAWLGSETGQRALDSIEKGNYDAAAWNELFAVRKAFGDDWFSRVHVGDSPLSGRANLQNLAPVVEAINAAKGDPDKVRQALGTLNGIGAGKDAFIAHMLGFGETPTVDARQINIWLTGKGNLRGDKSQGADAARLFRQSRSDSAVSQYMAERVRNNIAALKAEVPGMADVPDEAAGAILHQWMWDRLQNRGQEGKEPLHDHAGLYEALTLFQGAPKPGDQVKGKDGRIYRIETVDAAKGVARIQILDDKGNKLGVIRAAPIQRFMEEQKAARVQAVKDTAVDVINAPRTIGASLDLSAPLRQGAILSAAEPALAMKAGREMFNALSQKNYDEIVADLAKRDVANDYEGHNLYLASRADRAPGTPGATSKLNAREESFMSRLVGKIPLLGKGIQASERAMVGYLDTLRADAFDKFAEEVKAAKLSPEEETKSLEDIAHFINVATGRGDVPKFLDSATPVLNTAIFSTRFATSRLQFLYGTATGYRGMTPAARKVAMRSAVRYAGALALFLGMAKATGADVSLDPDSSDFLKAKWGDWRFDLGGGNIQVLRAIFRMAGGMYRNATGEGNKQGQNPADVVGTFLKSKESPGASYLHAWMSGKEFNGEKFDPVMGAVNRFKPMYLSDLYDAIRDEGLVGGLKTVPSLFGAGAQRYEEKPAKGGGGGGRFSPPGMPKLPEMPAMPKMPEMPEMPGIK
jgi:hypothetical protein